MSNTNSNLQITYRHLAPSEAVSAKIQQRYQKLQQFCDRIIHCQVIVEAPHQNHHKGNLYTVKIILTLPQKELVVGQDSSRDRSHENAYIAIRDAFDVAERQLKRYAEQAASFA